MHASCSGIDASGASCAAQIRAVRLRKGDLSGKLVVHLVQVHTCAVSTLSRPRAAGHSEAGSAAGARPAEPVPSTTPGPQPEDDAGADAGSAENGDKDAGGARSAGAEGPESAARTARAPRPTLLVPDVRRIPGVMDSHRMLGPAVTAAAMRDYLRTSYRLGLNKRQAERLRSEALRTGENTGPMYAALDDYLSRLAEADSANGDTTYEVLVRDTTDAHGNDIEAIEYDDLNFREWLVRCVVGVAINPCPRRPK